MSLDSLKQKVNEPVVFEPELEELIPLYYKNIQKDLFEMKNSLMQKNNIQISKVAHRVKGSAKSYGLDFLDALMREIECDVKNSGDQLQELIKLFETYVEKIGLELNLE